MNTLTPEFIRKNEEREWKWSKSMMISKESFDAYMSLKNYAGTPGRWKIESEIDLNLAMNYTMTQIVFEFQHYDRKITNLKADCTFMEQLLMEKLELVRDFRSKLEKDEEAREKRRVLVVKTGLVELPNVHPYELELSKAVESLWLNGKNKEIKVFYFKENYSESKVKEIVMWEVKFGITHNEMLTMFPNLETLYVKDCDMQRFTGLGEKIKIEKM